jgi:DNA modification methylase
MKFKIMTGDNRDTLKTLADNSIDAIVTDPPYGIDFLGKAWDANTGALETYQECLRVLKPGGHILAFSAARTYHHLAVTLEQAGFEIRDQIMWIYSSGFPKAQDIGKAIQKRKGVELTKPLVSNGPANGMARMTHNQSEPEKYAATKLATDIVLTDAEAQQWGGWKTALKPAHEPIALARKPFKGSTLDNVLAHGTGALNIDATRIDWDEKAITNIRRQNVLGGEIVGGGIEKYATVGEDAEDKHTTQRVLLNEQGRFPSNVLGEILQDDYQKYFYCPKVSRKERHIGFETKDIPTSKGGILGTDGEWSPEHWHGEKGQKQSGNAGNNHPTVKPIELMKYLINLITPPGGVVLDPFNGSGSTGMAAVELGFEYIGCELDPAYVAIAEQRIRAWNTPESSGTTYEELFE